MDEKKIKKGSSTIEVVVVAIMGVCALVLTILSVVEHFKNKKDESSNQK